MGKSGPILPQMLRNGQIWVLGPFFYPKHTEILTLIGVLGPFFFLPKTHRNGQMGFLGPFFTQNTQKWANLGLFLPQMLRNGQIWVLGPFFLPKIHRNINFNWGFRAFFFYPKHTEMGKWGF